MVEQYISAHGRARGVISLKSQKVLVFWNFHEEIGKNGINDGVINSIKIALNSKELIKIKFRDFKDQKKNLSEDIERLTNSSIVGIIGNILILYRESQYPDNIKIRI